MTDQRLTIDPQAAHEAGSRAGLDLITELCNMTEGTTAHELMADALTEVVILAGNQRNEEAGQYLAGFCAVIAPMLEAHCTMAEPEAALPEGFTESEGGEL